eukprot:4966422-Pleurochrysis_carterae.AAC.1
MAAMSPDASDCSSDSGCLNAMLVMSSAFNKSGVSAKERAALDSAFCNVCDSDSESDTPVLAAPAPAEQGEHSMAHETAGYVSTKGKYVRVNGKGMRLTWPQAAERHMQQVSNASLLSADRCVPRCSFGQTCLQSNFTLRTLRSCASFTYGEAVLDGKPPTTHNHSIVRAWFDLVYNCRVVVGNRVASIDLSVEGHRICEGAFAA